MARTAKPIDLAQVETLAAQGHTEGEIARRVGVSPDTLTRRKQQSADFADAIKRGQEAAHSIVANALFTQAKKGNVAAIVWYEKTRRGFVDTTRQEQTGPNGSPLTIKVVYADPDPHTS